MPIDEADVRLHETLPVYLRHAWRLSPGLEGERLVAVADFIFNLGPTRYAASTFRRMVNTENWERAAEECQRWVYGGGRPLPGLILRRGAEAARLLG
jgi:lysozyme